MGKNCGTLFLCATPIGNLEDITLRVLRVLSEVDLIAAEDTRHTRKLLNHFEIKKPLVSYFEHNEREKGEYLIRELLEGKNVALVSDAGMPGISDPGHLLVVAAREAGVPLVVLPGPTAAVTALVVSGFPTDRFIFEGFLPRDKKGRREKIASLLDEERTVIFYEAPHRLLSTLEVIGEILPERQIAVVRELTKKFEETVVGTAEELLAHYTKNPPKGEITLLVRGKDGKNGLETEETLDPLVRVKEYIDAGMDKKEAVKRVAKEQGLPKREVYRLALQLKEE